jgi:hypothetical protein
MKGKRHMTEGKIRILRETFLRRDSFNNNRQINP